MAFFSLRQAWVLRLKIFEVRAANLSLWDHYCYLFFYQPVLYTL